MRAAASATPWTYGRRRLTRVEMAVYAAICAVLIAVFLDRGADYMELAERTAMETTLNLATSAINTRLATALLQGPPVMPGKWAARNPFEITGTAPASFVGTLGSRDLGSLERPCWIFDEQAGELIYLPRLRRGLRTADGTGNLRFKLLSQPGGYAYELVSTSKYSWLTVQ